MLSPRVSIIIVNWNGYRDTSDCLESLMKINYGNYNVIVVDNCSANNEADLLKERFGQWSHIIANKNNDGLCKGNNIGIQYALNSFDPDYVLLLNNDTTVDVDFLTSLVDTAESKKSVGIVGGKIYFFNDLKQIQIVWGKTNLWHWQIFFPVPRYSSYRKIVDKGQYDYSREVDWVSGCCILIKNEVIKKIGSLEESYFAGWEDTDYCFYAKKAGFSVLYTHRAYIWHKNAQSFSKVKSYRAYLDARNRFIFMKRHASKPQYILFVLSSFTVYFWYRAAFYVLVAKKPAMLTSLFKGMIEGFSLKVNPVR